ncbi:MAG: leucyl/phenylalanyl-tRNA--protein transferase [Saprospiraceae bacterium]|nr:leucyl/phenylalanyl-tRNA--protein transferase [Saprospiraceae bacterium]
MYVSVSHFPHPCLANSDGLLAIGGDLDVDSLVLAYHFGIFPWYSEGQQILWWSPNPRLVLEPSFLKVSKSMRSILNKRPFRVTADHAFDTVIHHCKSRERKGQAGTWITDDMEVAYKKLHLAGVAHSIEVWQEEKLVGGLYGVALGKIFFGESMFTLIPNASKYGFVKLVGLLESRRFNLIDCQQDTPHMRSFGAALISRDEFIFKLKQNQLLAEDRGSWYGLSWDS